MEQWKEENGVYVKEELIWEYEKTQQAIRERQNAAEERRLKAARRAMEHRMVFTINGEDEAEIEKAIRG